MSPDAVRSATADHLNKMDLAIRAAGITPDEPLAPVLAEWRRSLAWAGELTALQHEAAETLSERLKTAIADVKAATPSPVDPVAIERLETAAANGAAQRARDLAQAHSWRTVAIATVAVTAAIMGGMGFGYWAGRHAAITTAGAIETAALRDGPDAGAVWLNFMRANSAGKVQAECDKRTAKATSGRRACGVGLWIDGPQNAGPGTAGAK